MYIRFFFKVVPLSSITNLLIFESIPRNLILSYRTCNRFSQYSIRTVIFSYMLKLFVEMFVKFEAPNSLISFARKHLHIDQVSSSILLGIMSLQNIRHIHVFAT